MERQEAAVSRLVFPKTRRLLTARQYKRVFAHGVRGGDIFFTVVATRRPEKSGQMNGRSCPCRLGLAISRKTARRAVDRNRIKRIVRESFRLIEVQWKNAIDVVVMAKPQTATALNRDLFASLALHWQRVSRDSRLDGL